MDETFKLNPKWIREVKDYFYEFLDETGFPDPERMGSRGPGFDYPERLIMLISILAVKCQLKSYVRLHAMAVRYWSLIRPNRQIKPISERQLRDRLKKIGYSTRRAPAFIFQIFPEEFFEQGGKRRQDDDKSKRTGVAQKRPGKKRGSRRASRT